MSAIARDTVLSAAGVALLTVALTWVAGGQALLGRIDPALALPLLPIPMLVLVWLLRSRSLAVRRATFGLALLLLLLLQAGLVRWLGGLLPWGQLLLVAVAAVIAEGIADVIGRLRAGRGVRFALALLLAAGWFAGGHALLALLYRPAGAQTAPVTILTGLPLRWSSGDIAEMLAQGTNDDPALVRLEAAGPVRLIDSLVDNPPPPGGTLLLAHPRALAPRELVAIDAFVRGGGRAMILADALSSWPGRYSLTDPRNAPVTSLLTPLLDHWGVKLGPSLGGKARSMKLDIGGSRIRLVSAGRFERLPPSCISYADRRIARCRIGRGTAWLVGDADLLFAPLWQPAPAWATHLRKADTIEWLAARLWADAPTAILQPVWIALRRD